MATQPARTQDLGRTEDWDDSESYRVPNLTLPFALVGLVAGWLSGRAIGGPMFDRALVGALPEWAALCGTLLGGVAGTFLWLRCKDELGPSMKRRPLPKIPLPAVVLIAGALCGEAVGLLLPYGDVFRSPFLGLLCAVPLIPVAAYVVAAARRAARARHGSLVAGSDRRAVWSALAVTLAITTLASLPEWSSALFLQHSGPPREAVLTALFASALIVGVLLLDLLSVLRLRRLVRIGATMEQREPGQIRDRTVLPCVDLGLGEDLLAEVAYRSAYRHAGRITSLLVGDPDEARQALRSAIIRSLVSTLIATSVVAIHALAAP